MDQNIDFFGSDQIQTPQYPDIHPPSQEISDEVFQAKGDLMKSIQTFLEEFNYMPFEEKPKILLQAWYKFFTIQYAQPKDSNELFQKLLEDLKELAEYVHTPSRDRPNFFDNNEDHSAQNKEYLGNSSNKIATSNSNEEKEGPPQDFDIQLVEICRQKELLCMHDNVDDLIESSLKSKLLSINSNSQPLDKKKQEVKNIVEQPVERRTLAPILSTKEPEYSPSMGYEHPNTTPEIELDEIIKSGVEELVPILNENESSISLNNTFQISLLHAVAPILSTKEPEYSPSMGDDDDFEDIEYIEASPFDPKIVNLEEENVVHQEEENVVHQEEEETRSDNTTTHANDSLPEYDSFCFEIEPDQERLINTVKNDISDDSSNDPLLEEADLFLAFNNSIPPGFTPH
nr:hypothetical protein [Tanacetum cinerariifolium]